MEDHDEDRVEIFFSVANNDVFGSDDRCPTPS